MNNKIKIIDADEYFNSFLTEILLNNINSLKPDTEGDPVMVFSGKLPEYHDILFNLSKYVALLSGYILVVFLIDSTDTIPKLIPKDIVVDYKQFYKHLIKAIRTLCKSSYVGTSLSLYEYTPKTKHNIVKTVENIIGFNNCDFYKSTYKRILDY